MHRYLKNNTCVNLFVSFFFTRRLEYVYLPVASITNRQQQIDSKMKTAKIVIVRFLLGKRVNVFLRNENTTKRTCEKKEENKHTPYTTKKIPTFTFVFESPPVWQFATHLQLKKRGNERKESGICARSTLSLPRSLLRSLSRVRN